MVFIWLSIVILLSIVEVMTINLTTVWFVVSGLVALVLAFLEVEFIVQFGVFTILGIFLLFTTRTWLQSKLDSKKQKTNLDRVIGMTGVVTEEISKNKPGEVKVDGKRWTAVADKKIEVDASVSILNIEGVKLVVKREED